MMNNDRLQEFLQEVHLMELGTITPQGFPHVTPVWYEWDGEHFFISTTRTRRKARNLTELPQAGFSISPEELSYKAVVGYGTVEMEPDPEGLLIERLCRRYLPADKNEKYFESIMKEGGSTRIKITLTPTWMTSWEG
jgi:PPOX class probable F420-dependent enzyme